MKGKNWTCPYCNRFQTITEGQAYETYDHIFLQSHKYKSIGLTHTSTACANPECGEVSLKAVLVTDRRNGSGWQAVGVIEGYNLRPQGASKPQPSCVPTVITEDYYEACKIRDLSPKASATLSRRCLQGMIRDFCGISKKRLVDEITALKTVVATGTGPLGVLPDTIEAIDHVRSIGNIGAHMEQDVSVIIPVEPGEAQALIELIGVLFEEWYVARELRQQKLIRVKTIGAEKQALKNTKPSSL